MTVKKYLSEVDLGDGNDTVSITLDVSATPPALTITDETNSTEQAKIPLNSDLSTELEAGGAMEVVIGNLLNFDPEAVLSGASDDRPAAGTTDRIFIDKENQTIQRDTGASWTTVGAGDIRSADGLFIGTEANRPAAGQQNSVAILVDTQRIQYDDGSDWNDVATAASDAAVQNASVVWSDGYAPGFAG